MKQITLRLDKRQQRPVVLLKDTLSALLDTGAYLPVWVDDEAILAEDLGAALIKKNIPFTGFGGTAQGNLYQVTIEVGDLIFPNMHIIANNDMHVPFNMILSATMFQNLIYEIDDKNHKLNISIPDEESIIRNLKIKESNGKLHIMCQSASEKEYPIYCCEN